MSGQNPSLQNRNIQWRFLAGLALSLLLLYFAFRQTDWGQMWTLFQAADRGLLLAAFFLNLLGLILRAGRWRLLFWRQEELPFSAFLDSVNIGYLVNNLFPVRLGDVVRSILLGRWLDLGAARAFSATVIERVLDSGIVLLLFFSLFLVLPLPPFALNLGLTMALAVTLAIGLMLLALWQQERAEKWLRALLDRIPFVRTETWLERIMGLIRGFGALRRGGVLLPFFGWSVIVWAQTVFAFWLTMRAFDAEVSFGLAALATAAAALGLAAPSAPAGLGTFEAAVIGALLLSGMEENLARSMAIALHFTSFIALNFAGFFSLIKRGIGYRHLVELAGQREPNAGHPAGPSSAP